MDVRPLDLILVPIDFTEVSQNALAVAVMLSQQATEIHLVYVFNPDAGQLTRDNGPGPHSPQEQLNQEGIRRIQELATRTAREHGVRCTSSYCRGSVPREVVATATLVNADLIVMGTLSGSDAETFRRGAEAYQIIKTVSCPVLTVPAFRKWAAFERILFPVRPIQGALDKYAFARKIIRRNEAELTVLALCAPDEVISIHQLQDEITALTGKLAQDEVKSQTLFVQTDSIAETVLEKADELKADLLIITASLSITTDNFFMGPFTQQIVYNAQVPVLAIRPELGMHQKTTPVSWPYGQMD